MAIIDDKYYKAFSCKKKPLHYMFRFNDFKLPSSIHLCQNKYFEYSSILFICVDHSFIEEVETYNENINIVFIDHHLAERNGIRYASNAKMMTELYSDLVKDLSDIAPSFQNIVVLMHNDLDGLASGIIIKSILNDIFNDNIDNAKITSGIALAEILGSYGDIDPDKEKLLGKCLAVVLYLLTLGLSAPLDCGIWKSFPILTAASFSTVTLSWSIIGRVCGIMPGCALQPNSSERAATICGHRLCGSPCPASRYPWERSC